MGRPKALLPYRKTTFSRSIVESLSKGGESRVCAVIGHEPGPIVAHLCDLGLRFVYNADWPKGQLSSIQTAVRACPKNAAGILVALVDQPGLESSTVRRMVREYRRQPGKILVASYRSQAGHPVVFPRRFFKELLAAPFSKGARYVVQEHLADRIFVETSDPAVVRDIDTPAQL